MTSIKYEVDRGDGFRTFGKGSRLGRELLFLAQQAVFLFANTHSVVVRILGHFYSRIIYFSPTFSSS